MPGVRSRWLAPLLVVVLLLSSGCVRLRTEVVISSDDTVRLTFDMGIESRYATGEPCNQFAVTMPVSATRTAYSEGGYTGCRTSAVLPITALESTMDGLSVTHADGRYTFRFRSVGYRGRTIDPATVSDFRVSVTFPGKVISTSGGATVSDRTVTWTDPQELVGTGLVAVGEDGKGLRAWLPWLVAGAVGVTLVAVGLGVTLAVRERRRRAEEQTALPLLGRRTGAPSPPDGASTGSTAYDPGQAPYGGMVPYGTGTYGPTVPTGPDAGAAAGTYDPTAVRPQPYDTPPGTEAPAADADLPHPFARRPNPWEGFGPQA